MTESQIKAYFQRIGYTDSPDLSYRTLSDLHTLHTTTIPFENFDVYLNRNISLYPDDLFDKIVKRKRGGYCFEMNGLFSNVLISMGFNVKRLIARVAFGGGFGAHTHEVMMVTINNHEYLCDVGFGNDGITAPLPIICGKPIQQLTNVYMFSYDERFGYVLHRQVGSDFVPMYAFTTAECLPEDYILSNHYTSTHPSSYFRVMRMITMPTLNGRKTLTDHHIKIIDNAEIREKDIKEDEFPTLLAQHFGLFWDEISDD